MSVSDNLWSWRVVVAVCTVLESSSYARGPGLDRFPFQTLKSFLLGESMLDGFPSG